MNGGKAHPARAVAIGDALMDTQYWVERIPAPGEDVQIFAMEENVGGSAANTAIGMAWLGIPCGFCGCVGDDPAGRRILDMMGRMGVDTGGIRQDGHTGYVLSMIDPTGERTMFSYRGASACGASEPELREALGGAELVLLSGYLLADKRQTAGALELMRLARGAGALVALDPSPRFGGLPEEVREAALSLCDFFLPNCDELTAAFTGSREENLERLAEAVPCVAVKLGGKGSLLAMKAGFPPHKGEGSPAQRLDAPSAEVTPLDTTGAGDAWNAGFLAAFLRGLPPLRWLEAGNELAARVITVKGATGLYKTTPPRRDF